MAFNFKNIKVLVVNDVESTRKLMVGILRILQVKEVYGASAGLEAFRIFKQQDDGYDIVITELAMTPGDGIQLAKKIRGADSDSPNRTVPIILSTGHTGALSIPNIRDAGFSELLLVPFAVDDIAQRIAYVLSNQREFIDIDNYAGPDRRRLENPNYTGPFRRHDDKEMGLGHAG